MADLEDLKRRMEGALSAFQKELSGLRTGRASANLVEGINVDAYGAVMPLNQVASINVPEPRLITLQVWDKELVPAVEKAIANANLGLNPASDGQLVRLPLPDLTEERRKELVKVAAKYQEQAKISVRNIRRDGMDSLKREEKEGNISQDEMHSKSEDVQKLTDDFIEKIDEAFHSKEKDILTV